MSAAIFPLVLLVAMATSMCLLCDVSAAPSLDQQPYDSLNKLSTNEVVDNIFVNQLAILQVLADRNEVSEESTELDKIQAVLQEMQANDATINHTLSTFEAELDRHKVEVATMTGKIQDQQRVIQQLPNFNNTLPGCVFGVWSFNSGYINTYDCFPFKCFNGTLTPFLNYTTGNRCRSPFENYKGECYHYNTRAVTWCTARKTCQQLGGELAMGNIQTLNEFVKVKNPTYGAWVGVRNSRLLNGQVIHYQRWTDGEPHSNFQCGSMWPDGLSDWYCDNTYSFICELF